MEVRSIEAVTKKELCAHPGWNTCTFERAETSTLGIGLKTTFRKKLEWLEEARTLILEMGAAREKMLQKKKKTSKRKR